ncbi:MAG TPA: glycosyltransferase family 2 protein [Caulobacteraceae bacterium]|jgi:glycosyltransferase involved in cell wall biosynthesis
MAVQVSVVIPTQRRPEGLARAVRSIMAQQGVEPATLELVVVDNDQVPSAKAAVEAFAAGAPWPVVYRHEPEPGVSSARNVGVAAVRGAFIAFLDDDEEARPHWLAALLYAQRAYDADVVFGPVTAQVPERLSHRDYLQRFFSRQGPAQSGSIGHFYGCGNSLIRLAALPEPEAPFPLERNQSGGEDDVVFRRMRAAGARFAWAADAEVWEHPAPERMNLAYVLRRAFAFGQGGSSTVAGRRPRHWVRVAVSMAKGVVQAGGAAALAALFWAARSPRYVFLLEHVARGLGKVFWSRRFYAPFYGKTAGQAS